MVDPLIDRDVDTGERLKQVGRVVAYLLLGVVVTDGVAECHSVGAGSGLRYVIYGSCRNIPLRGYRCSHFPVRLVQVFFERSDALSEPNKLEIIILRKPCYPLNLRRNPSPIQVKRRVLLAPREHKYDH
jgi:hypothetical protein